MRIKVDWDLCKGHGECEGEAPAVFALDKDGKLQILEENPDESQRENVLRAIKFCPSMALSIDS